jgi:hypothetical protein
VLSETGRRGCRCTPAVEVAVAFEPPLPAPGTASVAFANGRVSIRSNGAQRWAILEQLAQKAGFELFRGDLKRQALTLRIEDAPLSEALATLLVGVHYSLELDFDAAKDLHVIREVAVGRQWPPRLPQSQRHRPPRSTGRDESLS